MRDFLLPGGLLGLVLILFIAGALLAQPLFLLGAMCVVWPAFWSATTLAAIRFKTHYRIIRNDQPQRPARREVLS